MRTFLLANIFFYIYNINKCFFIRHKEREEKDMKRIKMLLIAILCVVMTFGAASVPASAEII